MTDRHRIVSSEELARRQARTPTSVGRADGASAAQFLFLRNAKAITGLVILGFFFLIAIIGPWIAPYDPSARSDDILQPPSWQHWFGTTHLGQDVFSPDHRRHPRRHGRRVRRRHRRDGRSA